MGSLRERIRLGEIDIRFTDRPHARAESDDEEEQPGGDGEGERVEESEQHDDRHKGCGEHPREKPRIGPS